MAFAVVCKSCQARFLLNDDLLRRKVAGRVVTVRCRQCHATIEVDASDVDPKKLAEVGRGTLPLVPAVASATETPQPKALRPAPSPPRPPAKSTLMGIGAPKPPGATELVALSPGLLGVDARAPAAALSPEGFPEPPPPPPPASVEVLDESDWEVQETPALSKADPAPESVDDFVEELPPSLPPPVEEMPSSAGTPSLQALTHHDTTPQQPRVDEFLANMTAAMNGGMMVGAPTIDVSDLGKPPPAQTAEVDLTALDVPLESGKKTLPLFALPGAGEVATPPRREPREGPVPPKDPTRGQTAPMAAVDGSLSPTALEAEAPVSERPDSKRERRNVVAPATKSIPPAAPDKQRSLWAAPLLLAVAAAAGFLIYKRSAPPTEAPRAEAAAPQPVAATPAPEPTPVAEPPAPAPEPLAASEDDVTFETTSPAVAAARPAREPEKAAEPSAALPAPEPKSEPTAEAPSAAVAEAPKPEPTPREPAAEPSGPFDRAAAAEALTSSATRASACRKEGDPSGVASVVVTFAPSGRVTSANISGPPFAGTPTGGCIASELRKARVPAFVGERVTVSKTVVIQ